MQWSDLLIIYLSCGAPFGVHFFLQNRRKLTFGPVLLRSFGAGLFWIAYAYLLWRKNFAKRLTPAKKTSENFSKDPEISLLEQQTSVLQEQILQSFIELKVNPKPGFFAFRYVLERYAGLTLAVKAEEKAGKTTAGEIDFEVFRIAGRKKKELPLAGKCLARKNSMRLYTHQSNARNDFLDQLATLARASVQTNGNGSIPNISLFRDLILELFELIDVKTLQRVENVFEVQPVERENGLHMPEVVKCQPQQPQIPFPAPTPAAPMRMTAKSRGE